MVTGISGSFLGRVGFVSFFKVGILGILNTLPVFEELVDPQPTDHAIGKSKARTRKKLVYRLNMDGFKDNRAG